jgi:hypothetical protein
LAAECSLRAVYGKPSVHSPWTAHLDWWRVRGLSGFHLSARQFPVTGVGATREQDAAGRVTDRGEGRRTKRVRPRSGRVVVVLGHTRHVISLPPTRMRGRERTVSDR